MLSPQSNRTMYSLVVFLLAAPVIAQAKSVCEGLVWTMDDKLNMCLAKHCSKAGKGEYTSTDIRTCERGLLMDYFSCGGGVMHETMCEMQMLMPVPLLDIDGTAPVTEPPPPLCPKGNTCIWGAFGFGFCCEDKNQEVWHDEYAAKCASPMKTVNITQNVGDGVILRGKSCKDLFCPTGSKCVQGTHLAHCCI
ncbi:hypothetical protein PFISCL1PPCAC_3269 [Pristionchus fissidentatus]|uniref:Uncharacterized protein n=1 Tax=Pristionchus fissidentatus TaxID=1538716 RepID=A0AAV5UZE6_9BILA|nr:hypothetical protein PFISCL1PPCAC_3269 [Pristionchus fissidentatus]